MTQLKILNSNQKQDIVNKLKKQFGIENIKGIFVQHGAERLFLFQGELTQRQIHELERTIPIERVGVYFGKIIHDEIRLSIEGVHLLKNQITKNIFELDKEQAELWMKGNELEIQTGKKEFVIIKYKDDFLGCGKASELKITNFIPKSRRLKK